MLLQHGPLQSRKLSTNEQVKQFAGLKRVGFNDYLSARRLFDSNMLASACILANTCIEKELKTCLIAMGSGKSLIKLGHNTVKLLGEFEKLDPIRCSLINKDFILSLSSIYNSRYHDALPVGYRQVIVRNKFLAEMDFTYLLLTQVARKESPFSGKLLVPFERVTGVYRDYLYKNNFILNKIKKDDFLKGEDYVEEIFVDPGHRVYEMHYNIDLDPNPKKFIFDNSPLKFEKNGDYIISCAYPDYKNFTLGTA